MAKRKVVASPFTNAEIAHRVYKRNSQRSSMHYDRAKRDFTAARESYAAAHKTNSPAVRAGWNAKADLEAKFATEASAKGRAASSIAIRALDKGMEARVGRIRANVQNSRIAQSTGLPRPVANVVGAVARNPGRAGLALAAAAVAATMLRPSTAKAESAKPASDKPSSGSSVMPSTKDVVRTGIATAASYGALAALTRFTAIPKLSAPLRLAIAAGSATYATAIDRPKTAAPKKVDEPKKDRTSAYTDSLGRVYADGRKITRASA